MSALPPNPSLKHLRNEAKQLLKALKGGSAEAAARVGAALPRLSGAPEADVLAGEVTLQEAQHVLAREYGFATWPDLTEAVEPVFEQLACLTDDELTELLREVHQKDVTIALVGAPTGPESFRTRSLMVMSKRVRLYILEEMEFAQPTPEESAASRTRISETARRLGDRGRIDWPPGSGRRAAATDAPPQPGPPAELPPDLALLEQPLDDLTLDEIRRALHALTGLARERGVSQVEQAIATAGSDFVIEGLRLVADGTEPDLVMDLLEMRMDTLVRDLVVRMSMVIEGAAATSAGDYPHVVRRKVNALYSRDFRQEYRDTEGTVQQVRRRLSEHPASDTSLDELNELIADLATIVRRGQMSHTGGRETVLQVLDLVDDPFLAEGIRAIASGEDWRVFCEDLKRRKEAARLEALRRYRLVCDGLQAIQERAQGERLDEILDAGQRTVV